MKKEELIQALEELLEKVKGEDDSSSSTTLDKLKMGDIVRYRSLLSEYNSIGIYLYKTTEKVWLISHHIDDCPQQYSVEDWIFEPTGQHLDLQGALDVYWAIS